MRAVAFVPPSACGKKLVPVGMKGTRLVLIPITAAWIAGSLWYMISQNVCDCLPSPAASHASTVSIIHLGPAAEAVPSPSDQRSPLATTIVSDPFVPELTLRFIKNDQDLQLTDDEQRWCEQARDHLASHPLARLRITGYTDGDGDAELNKRLSLNRAHVVRDRLVGSGIPAERIDAEGLGAANPVADNLTSKGKALNRRVEVHVIQGE